MTVHQMFRIFEFSRAWKDAEFKVIYIKMFDRADRGGNCEKKSHNQDDWQASYTWNSKDKRMINWNFHWKFKVSKAENVLPVTKGRKK